MTPDVDLTAPKPGRHAVRDALLALDCRLFEFAAERNWPLAEPVLPRLSRSANHGVLWFAAGAVMAASRTPRARRAAARGLASLSLASLTINTLGKRSVRRPRPVLDPVPLVRQLKRQPITTSFPSGHAATSFAGATMLSLFAPRLAPALYLLAASIAFSRIYVGVHWPLDVLAGAVLGTLLALLASASLRRLGRSPRRSRGAPPPG